MVSALAEVKRHPIEAGGFLVIACDGIWERLESQAAVDRFGELLGSSEKISDAIGKVFEEIIAPDTKDGKGCDNMTCVVV